MRSIFVVALFCVIVTQIFADSLECYQCEHVTSECTTEKAVKIKCGSATNSRCSRQVKKGSSDPTMAIRKCVVPDTNGQVRCPDGFDCHTCDSELCNTGTVTKSTFVAVIASIVAALYRLQF